ncbi:MAG TPA: hypothetical protein VNI20_12940 [Fimbriimonadaceae bacterium]|nr:hypothetical protein [Fimbriimonadaceae bacterium]
MNSEPQVYEQFFRRSSSGDWVYIGYGPDVVGRIVSAYDREWLLENIPTMARWKRWTVGLFSAPLCWLVALIVNGMVRLPGTTYARLFFRNVRALMFVAAVLLALFVVASIWLGLQPLTREFGRLLGKSPKEDPVGVERFMRNLGAVNGPAISLFLVLGIGAIVVPSVFRSDTWFVFLPFSAAWFWFAYNAVIGAFWRPSADEE